ncbi:MAG: tetratricopeptide repeat protein [Selenomonadaceae bacterium]|nr:tetratricopeptide repeat protein [Selenomonadaceae bacterium]
MLGKKFLVAMAAMSIFNLTNVNFDENINFTSKVYAATNAELAEEKFKEGQKIYNNNDFEKAILKFNEVIELNPNHAETYNLLGMSYYRLGKFEKAVENYTKAIELNPKNASNYSGRGFSYEELGKYEEALADFQEAGRVFPNYRHIGKIISNIYFKMGRYEESLAEITDDIDRYEFIDRGHPDFGGYVQRAKIYKELKKYDEAIADCNKAIEFKNDYAEAYYERGKIYQEIGENELAEEDFEKASELGYEE